ncbi:MAG: STAS domain-containing protein [Candidatus Auribacter fodinae]|jgi:SulP family sulfate permease|uniref:STAS domain-containing protein n=1 Tax=Candidatus Auribacter fodinae TaxID=2093366 RepID=A0A3A4RBC8_9BACT|nr:MAG: STAS domain-containing protein [Candidatus Auribacter fodinae]
MLKPKLLDTLKTYSWAQFHNDLIAGLVVGVVALPLAIAFAIASGVSPEKGLVTAIIAGFIISALGGSRVQIGGPTGAFVVVVFDIIQRHGMDGLIIATFMGGIMLIIFGFARFGSVIKFIPYPVIIGFTSGIAVIIFSSQIKDLLGLTIAEVPANFFSKWHCFITNITSINPAAVGISFSTIGIILLVQKLMKRIPGSLVAIIVTTLAAYWFKLPVETIGDRFGVISSTLPAPIFPSFNLALLQDLIRPAFTIAMLAGIESLLSAIVADGMIGAKHRSNMELIAQGIANVFSPLFGGIPATGAIARTATNVHNGGRTPIAGIIHALTLYIILLFFGKWAALIPLATLAGILVIVSYRMAEWHSFSMVLRSPRSDVVVLLIVFSLTIIFDLTVAIEVGIVLASFLFIRRLSTLNNINEVQGVYLDEEDRDDPDAMDKKVIPHGVELYEINGPFFFGVASTFIEMMNNIEKSPMVRIFRMRHVSSIDATGLNALRQVTKESKKRGIILVLSGVRAHLRNKLEKTGIIDLIGAENVLPNIDRALEHAGELVASVKK